MDVIKEPHNPKKYKGLKDRVFADFGNEIVDDFYIVGLSKSDYINSFSGESVKIKEGDYIYMFMPIDEVLPEYLFAEGVVIKNPYEFKPYKWCCKIIGEFEYIDEYDRRFKK
ncbi:hypothetical protein [Pectobacterium polaris]|uniref:hypothetical protein n=1 Tax=Pectobacterium polaris TaxID=2042057 RepID=UPI001581BAD6|nr:hypothetical protein [Pectobacterium polaris]